MVGGGVCVCVCVCGGLTSQTNSSVLGGAAAGGSQIRWSPMQEAAWLMLAPPPRVKGEMHRQRMSGSVPTAESGRQPAGSGSIREGPAGTAAASGSSSAKRTAMRALLERSGPESWYQDGHPLTKTQGMTMTKVRTRNYCTSTMSGAVPFSARALAERAKPRLHEASEVLSAARRQKNDADI